MSRTLEIARQYAWQDRHEYGRDTTKRRKWAVDTWVNSGLITSAQAEAAHRLWRLIEGGWGPDAGAGLHYVDGGSSDPHARVMAAASKRRQVEAIHHWMRARLQRQIVKPGAKIANNRNKRWELYVLLFDANTAQPTALELAKALKMGESTRRAAETAQPVLDLLAVRFGMLDADGFDENRLQTAWRDGTNQLRATRCDTLP